MNESFRHTSDTPYTFQKADAVPEEWRDESCAIACVKMIIDHIRPLEAVSMKSLLEEGVALDGFSERGWKHDVLVRLLNEHGVPAHREEFRDPDASLEIKKREEGLARIEECAVSKKPVMVSIKKDNGSYHIVLVVGKTEDGFIVHDSETGPDVPITKEIFQKIWRGLAIFVD